MIFSIGAVIGADDHHVRARWPSRTGEIGTLRALGFRRARGAGGVPRPSRCSSACSAASLGVLLGVRHAAY
ncbi:MAG: hypothetical protein MZW92_38235 [Comamonadaceae bacterium]|nr:hypothetical protein [Comamonadaceae bacterium]